MTKALAVIALAAGMAATIARAARYPNNFAKAHWLIDYRFGFIKRALAGTVLRGIYALDVAPYRFMVLGASFAVLGALCVALLLVAVDILRRSGWSREVFLALAAFVTSPFVVTAAHLVGYLDLLVLVLTLAAVWLVRLERLWGAGVLCVAAALVHESFAVLGLPLVAAAIVFQNRDGRRELAMRLLVLLPAVLAIVALTVSESLLLDRGMLRQQLVDHLSRYPFVQGDMNVLVPEWLTTPLSAHVREQAHAFPARISDPGFLIRIVPTAGILLGALALELRDRRSTWFAVFTVAAAAPLLLHLIAWDTARIWSYPIAIAFGALWVGSGGRDESRSRLTIAAAAGLVICWNVFLRYPLLDGEVDRFSGIQRIALYAPFLTAFLATLRAPF
jgi:hypothetical protein